RQTVAAIQPRAPGGHHDGADGDHRRRRGAEVARPAPWPRRRQRSRHATSQLLDAKLPLDDELEPPARGALEADPAVLLREAAAQEDEAALEVVLERRQAEGGVEAQLLVGERHPA